MYKHIKKYNSLTKLFIVFLIIGLVSILANKIGISLCPFYNTTGVPCPSCGMTRAYISLFHLDIKGAFFYNPCFILVPFIFVPFLIPFIKIKGKNLNIKKSTSNMYFCFLCLILIITWIIRLFLFFPNTEPMTYNFNSIIYKIYSFVVT